MAWSSMEGFRNSFRWRSETRKLITIVIPRSPMGFGFTVAWSKPPEVNFVSEDGEAFKSGLLRGDKLIYINKVKIAKKDKEEITDIVKTIKDEMELEIARDFSKTRQASLRVKRGNVKDASHIYVQDTNLISWKREKALLSLLQSEDSFLNVLRCGKEKYVLPLRREPRLATAAELDILFSNILPFYSIYESHIHVLQEVTQRSKDIIGELYQNQLGSRCQMLEIYLSNLPLAKIMLNYKIRNKPFRVFLTSCKEGEGNFDILSFLEKPYEHLEVLLSNLETVLSFTAVGHQDYVALENAVSRFRQFQNSMKLKIDENVEDENALKFIYNNGDEFPYPNLEELQKRTIFPTGLKAFNLIYSDRYWLFAGQLLKVDEKYYVQHFAMLLSDALILMRKTSEGILLVLESPIMLKNIRHVTFDVQRCDKEFCLTFAEKGVVKRNQNPSIITWTLRAQSLGLKLIWKRIIEQQISKLNHVVSENETSPAINNRGYAEECFPYHPKPFDAEDTENKISYVNSVVERAKSLAEEAICATSPLEESESGSAMQELKVIKQLSADCESWREKSQIEEAKPISRSRSADSPICKTRTPQRPSRLVETTFVEGNRPVCPIPFIDSLDGGSSGTESNIFGDDDDNLSPSRSAGSMSKVETIRIENVENEPIHDTLKEWEMPKTQDQIVQTDVTCWTTMSGGSIQLPKKQFPRLGTFDRLHLSKPSKPGTGLRFIKPRRFRLLPSASFPVQSGKMDMQACSSTNSTTLLAQAEDKDGDEQGKQEKEVSNNDEVSKLSKTVPEREKERFSWFLRRKKEVKTEDEITAPVRY